MPYVARRSVWSSKTPPGVRLRLRRKHATRPHPPAPAAPDGALALERFEVRGEKEVPDFSPPRETPAAKFFRTGTIRQRVGDKVTTRLWSSGDAGVVLTFSW